ncbi:hypothetical protein ACKWTF_015240 [Chironomus riparius]
MKSNFDALLQFFLLLYFIHATEAQTAKCFYTFKYYETKSFKTTNTSYYRCDLDTKQGNYNEKLIRIDGQHGTGHSDADVKWIISYKNHKLKTFSSIFCQKFPNLEVIQINDAELEVIDEDSLSNCKNLDQLISIGNKIREIPENLLTQNLNLTYLWISNNQLTSLPENLFLNQKELEELYLYYNQINVLPSIIFRPLAKLQVLYLNNNKLQSINPEWFVTLLNLKWLGLQGNQISEIPSKAFAALRNLEKLWLFENRIKTLKSDNFYGLQNLKTLSLHTNEISDLPVGVFTKLNNLQDLNLKNNKLTTIHSDSFGVSNNLTKLWLVNNKISSIDPKFIDNIAVSILNMTNNICSQTESKRRSEVENNLKDCFVNYRPRSVQIPNSCGRPVMPQGSIIGGAEIKRNSYPWIAALMKPTGQFFCGGTLVSSRKVVTAAHCIQNKGETQQTLPSSVIVLLGFHDLSNSIEVGRVPYAVKAINIHSDWNPYTTSYDADIAVLVLDHDVIFNNYIQPICMTSTDPRIVEMTEGAVVGNGKGGEANEYEKIPKILKMPIQTARHCTEKDSTFQQLLTGRTFCAGSGTGQGVCTGDSGSGFIVQIGNSFYLRGIVSASLGDSILGCDVDSYSVFTDALKYINWIKA